MLDNSSSQMLVLDNSIDATPKMPRPPSRVCLRSQSSINLGAHSSCGVSGPSEQPAGSLLPTGCLPVKSSTMRDRSKSTTMQRSVSWAAGVGAATKHHAPAPVPQTWSPAQHEITATRSAPAGGASNADSDANSATTAEERNSDRSDETTSSDPDSHSSSTSAGNKTSCCKPRLLLLHVEADVETVWGDTVVLVGSTPQLGRWTVSGGLPLTTEAQTYPRWRLSACIELDDGRPLQQDSVDASADCLDGVGAAPAPGGSNNIEFKLVVVHAPDADGAREPARWEVFGAGEGTRGDASANRRLHLGSSDAAGEGHQALEAHLLLRWCELPMDVKWCVPDAPTPLPPSMSSPSKSPSKSPQNISPALPREFIVSQTPLTAEAFMGGTEANTAAVQARGTGGKRLSRPSSVLRMPRGASCPHFAPLSSVPGSDRPSSAQASMADGPTTSWALPLSVVVAPRQPSRQVSALELPPAATAAEVTDVATLGAGVGVGVDLGAGVGVGVGVGMNIHVDANKSSAEAAQSMQQGGDSSVQHQHPQSLSEMRRQMLRTLTARPPLPD